MVILEATFLALFFIFILLLIFFVILPIRRIEPLAINTLNNINTTATNLNNTINLYKPSVGQTITNIDELATDARPVLDSVETALCSVINPRPAYCPSAPPSIAAVPGSRDAEARRGAFR